MGQHATMGLVGRNGQQALLEGVSVSGNLRGLLLDMTVEQRFCNPTATNLEVIYRFPLPWGAVLLDIDVLLNGEPLTGEVVEKRQAEDRYEEALSQGQSAILLERNRDGSYSLNLGNLLAGETCQIRLRYAQVLRFEQGGLRLLLPAVIAPRYGDAVRDGGLPPHLTPVHDPLVSYPLTLRLNLHGPLALARVASPSHPIAVVRESIAGAEVLTVTLARQGTLDRDFVLVVDQLAQSSLAVLGADCSADPEREQIVVLASFLPQLAASPQGQALKILVDCSGSMAGDSIAAARRALQAILGALTPTDHFSLSRFGSTVQHRSRGLWATTEVTRLSARRWVAELEADLGGTEMHAALVATFALPHAGHTDLLLITDGEIEGIDAVITAARHSGHRLFIVGIGASPAEIHLRRLATATGGACDFVAPGEAVEPAVTRMFARLRSSRLDQVRLDWPAGYTPLWEVPLASAVFAGDTVSVFAGFATRPSGTLTLVGASPDAPSPVAVASVTLDEVTPATVPAPLAPGDALARLAAMARYEALTAAADGAEGNPAATALALTYQLVTDRTHFLLVHERSAAETPTAMPELHSIAQMLSAGWGGTGSVMYSALPPPPMAHSATPLDAVCAREGHPDLGYLDLPAFSRRGPDHDADSARQDRPQQPLTPLGLSNWLRRTPHHRWPRTYEALRTLGLDPLVVTWLERVLAEDPQGHWPEDQVVATFLAYLESGLGRRRLAKPNPVTDRFQRLVRSTREVWSRQPTRPARPALDSNLATRLEALLEGMTAGSWPISDGSLAD